MEQIEVLLITQARVGSTRFPNKVISPLADTTLLGLHLERVKKSKLISQFCVATTNEIEVEKIIEIAKKSNVDVFQGDLNDVLDRFYQAAVRLKPDYIVRVTSDCPLIDANLIDSVIDITIKQQADYGSNMLLEHFPDGQDVEVFTFHALETAWNQSMLQSEREHVTPYIRNNSDFKGRGQFKSVNFDAPKNFNHVRMTVDEPSDLEAIDNLVAKLGKNQTWDVYTQYIIDNINEFNNQDIIRNEGYLKSIKKDNLIK